MILFFPIQGEISGFIDSFLHFDADNSGSISGEELLNGLKWLGMNPDPQFAKELFERNDRNGNGVLEFDEFVSLMSSFYPEKQQEFDRQFISQAKRVMLSFLFSPFVGTALYAL